MSKRRHNFGTKRFKEKSVFIFHARIALKSLILLFVRLIARGARIGKTHTHTHRLDRQDKYCNPRACAPRVNYDAGLNARGLQSKLLITPLIFLVSEAIIIIIILQVWCNITHILHCTVVIILGNL